MAYQETELPAATALGCRAGRKTGAEGRDPWRAVVVADEAAGYGGGVYPAQLCT